MKAQNVLEIMKQTPMWENDTAKFWKVDAFNDGFSWVGKFSGQSPWEMHPDGDELISIIEGVVETTVLMDSNAVKTVISAGSVYTVPKGRWHCHFSEKEVLAFGATPGRSEYSNDEDPRKSDKNSA